MIPIIKVENLSKKYHLGAPHKRHETLREALTETVRAPLNRLRNSGRSSGETIWALNDVSFTVEPGEVVGIIGRNGAGKSTLLKILSRITEPTSGRAEIRGRIASLLEVGTGFHPELTGRENIYLNGAILGMSRREIERNFDEIVSFAEVEKFIDTPVKHYSSGMYLRLAFAVAAHLEPEILVVDEVLAVGDAQFQKKCLGKMGNVAKQGRTVLLVSHSLGAINQLCQRCLWMDGGGLRKIGDTSPVIDSYLSHNFANSANGPADFEEDASKNSQVRSARFLNDKGVPTYDFECDSPVIIEIVYQVHKQVAGSYGCFEVYAGDGAEVLVSYSHDMTPNPIDNLPVGTYVMRVVIPARSLGHGNYHVQFSIGRMSGSVGSVVDRGGILGSFSLNDLSTPNGNQRLGYFSTLLNWSVGQDSRNAGLSVKVL